MNQSAESAAEKAHYEWAKGMAKLSLDRQLSELELRSLGRVPWFAAIQWRDKNPSDEVRALVEALEVYANPEAHVYGCGCCGESDPESYAVKALANYRQALAAKGTT